MELAVTSHDRPRPIDCFYIPYSTFTPDAEIEGRLVYVDRHRLRHTEDWRGAIVIADIGYPALDVKLLLKLPLVRTTGELVDLDGLPEYPLELDQRGIQTRQEGRLDVCAYGLWV